MESNNDSAFVAAGSDLRYFPRWRGRSEAIVGPYCGVGDCLAPHISDGTLVWFDTGLEARDGDVVAVGDPPDGVIKLLGRINGTQTLLTNVAPYRRDGRAIRGVAVAAILPLPGAPSPFPERSAAAIEDSRRQREMLARAAPKLAGLLRRLLAEAFATTCRMRPAGRGETQRAAGEALVQTMARNRTAG